MLKKLKMKWYWIVIAVVILLAIVGVSVYGEKLFQKSFWQDIASKVSHKNEPKQPQCTADTTISCSNGETIVTQACNDGVLVNTGKICPCIANITISCEGGTVIVTQLCENGVLKNTGKICPCLRNTTITCADNSVVVTQVCANGVLSNTGKICPCFSDSVQTCYDGTTAIIQKCINGVLSNTGNACPQPPAPVNTQVSLNVQRLQGLFQKSSYFTRLPSNAAVLLTFFDGNGAARSEKFFIAGGGVISNYDGRNYDLEFTMGDYRVPELESSSDFCASLTQIKSQQDLRVGLKNVLSAGKYLYLKDCVPF